MTMLLSTPDARAGTWLFHCTGSGTITTDAYTASHPGYPPMDRHQSAPFSPPTDSTNQMMISDRQLSDQIAGQGSTCAGSLGITATITATWVPDPNLPSDPAPPKTEAIETADASRSGTNGDGSNASGSVSNGLDPASTSVLRVVTPTTDANGKTLVPPSHLLSWSGSSYSFTRTFSVTANSAVGATGPCSVGVYLNTYIVQIHPQPYNWHITSVNNNGDGSLTFYYDWQSTSGSKSDLTSCYIHEWVTYPGPQGTASSPLVYAMPAPFSGGLWNPTVLPGTGSNGQLATDPKGGNDHQGVPALSSPPYGYVSGGFTATQAYEFDDTATGETNVIVPGPDSGPLSIVRSAYTFDNITYFYTLTKSGYTVTATI